MTTLAYRSSHPDVLAAWADTQTRFREWHAKVSEWRADYPEHHAAQQDWTGSLSIVGLIGDTSPGPGWRHKRGQNVWVPDQRTKAGKALAERIAALKADKIGDLPGMPDTASSSKSTPTGGYGLCHPGMFEHDGTVWVSWNATHKDVAESGWSTRQLDMTIWEQAPLSAFYAATEDADRAKVVA